MTDPWPLRSSLELGALSSARARPKPPVEIVTDLDILRRLRGSSQQLDR